VDAGLEAGSKIDWEFVRLSVCAGGLDAFA
jgi:hypothetical protein